VTIPDLAEAIQSLSEELMPQCARRPFPVPALSAAAWRETTGECLQRLAQPLASGDRRNTGVSGWSHGWQWRQRCAIGLGRGGGVIGPGEFAQNPRGQAPRGDADLDAASTDQPSG